MESVIISAVKGSLLDSMIYSIHKGDDKMNKNQIMAPVNGQAMSLSEVKDVVFASKMLGDGMAILAEDGKIVSPVDGKVASVAEGRHTYGFLTDDEVNVLVHVGLESFMLRGDGFKVFVKPGDKVKAGDLVAEVDIEFLKEKGICLATPVLVCNKDAQERIVNVATGAVKAGETAVITLEA